MEERVYEIELGKSKHFEEPKPLLHEDTKEPGYYYVTAKLRNIGGKIKDFGRFFLVKLDHGKGIPPTELKIEWHGPIGEEDFEEPDPKDPGVTIWKSGADFNIRTESKKIDGFDPSHQELTTCHIIPRSESTQEY